MNSIKQCLKYSLWTVLALILGMAYMRWLLGPNGVPSEGLWILLNAFYNVALFHVGGSLGLIVAFLFILLDVFYLKKHLQSHGKRTLFRLGWLLLIALLVTSCHYFLEKGIDVL